MSDRLLRMKRDWIAPLVGAVLWCVMVGIFHPSPFDLLWGQLLLLLAPLVLVPLVLSKITPTLWKGTDLVHLPAAALLPVAFCLEQGLPACLLSVPWLLFTMLLSLQGLHRLIRGESRSMADLCVTGGLIYLGVGGAWTCADRLGMQPLQFDKVIVLLTAIHFHYAGLLLPVLTGFALKHVGGILARPTGIGVLVGVPLTAVGITATQLKLGPIPETIAALFLSLSGMAAGLLYLRLAGQPHHPIVSRVLWTGMAFALLCGMLLSSLYGLRFYIASPLDIPWMRALHGTGNALGFGLLGVAGWVWRSDTP